MAINLAQASATSQPAPAQDQLALKQVLETIDAQSCPHSFNFHMHTVYSDGNLQPDALIEQAVKLGLKGLAITDHHSVRGYQMAQRWLEEQQGLTDVPHLWTGMEITSSLLETEVHILCYAFNPEHPAMQVYMQGKSPQGSDALAVNVISAVHQANGLAVLAHPVRYRLGATELIPAAAESGIDGVETYYAYNNPKPWQPSPAETQQVKQLAATYSLLSSCGTDTHGLSLLQRL